MPYGRPWENLSHKGINILVGSSKLPYLLDPTTQWTEISNYYLENFQGQIENISQVETYIRFSESESSVPVGRIAQIQEDTPSSDFLSTHINQPSDADTVLTPAETYIRFSESESSVPVGRIAQIQEDTPSSDFLFTHINQPSDVDTVLTPAETYIRFSESESSVPVGRIAQIQEDTPSSDFLSTHINQPSDVDTVLTPTDTGTAITDFTRLRKHQIKNQKLEISERFDVLSQREDNWDGYDSKKPTK